VRDFCHPFQRLNFTKPSLPGLPPAPGVKGGVDISRTRHSGASSDLCAIFSFPPNNSSRVPNGLSTVGPFSGLSTKMANAPFAITFLPDGTPQHALTYSFNLAAVPLGPSATISAPSPLLLQAWSHPQPVRRAAGFVGRCLVPTLLHQFENPPRSPSKDPTRLLFVTTPSSHPVPQQIHSSTNLPDGEILSLDPPAITPTSLFQSKTETLGSFERRARPSPGRGPGPPLCIPRQPSTFFAGISPSNLKTIQSNPAPRRAKSKEDRMDKREKLGNSDNQNYAPFWLSALWALGGGGWHLPGPAPNTPIPSRHSIAPPWSLGVNWIDPLPFTPGPLREICRSAH